MWPSSAGTLTVGSSVRTVPTKAITASSSLCAPRGPRLRGTKPGRALGFEGGLRLIKRRPRTAERVGRLGDRLVVDVDPPEHFVFHLHEIARIEKLVRPKQRVADLGGAGMQ